MASHLINVRILTGKFAKDNHEANGISHVRLLTR